MIHPAPPVRKQLPLPALIALVTTVVVAGLALFYFSRTPRSTAEEEASQEARAYVHNLQLSDVTMEATENFMKQQVVEIQGKIVNQGPKPVSSVDVFCLFQGIDGRELRRERLPMVQSKATPLKPGETRPFRLPFDNVPEGWNQAMPRMVIARITFTD